jgi:hypothetical protein
MLLPLLISSRTHTTPAGGRGRVSGELGSWRRYQGAGCFRPGANSARLSPSASLSSVRLHRLIGPLIHLNPCTEAPVLFLPSPRTWAHSGDKSVAARLAQALLYFFSPPRSALPFRDVNPTLLGWGPPHSANNSQAVSHPPTSLRAFSRGFRFVASGPGWTADAPGLRMCLAARLVVFGQD